MQNATEFPTAEMRPRTHLKWLWFFPLLALIGVGILVAEAWHQQGILIKLTFERGHGLKAGDALIHRGIQIGQVTTVELSPDLAQVQVAVRVAPSAKDIARQGSRFWIVRPQIDTSGVTGLDTVIGANYLRVLPGSGIPETHFSGLETPPLLDELDVGGLQIILRAAGKGSLQRNAPVIYRQVAIGKIVQVDLAPDASAVETLVYIKPKYVHLIRNNIRFWRISGASIQAGWLSGLSLQLDSIQSLIAGGVMIAIPPELGTAAPPKQRFTLYDAPEPDWLEWTAYVSPLSDLATTHPHSPLLQASLSWYPDNYFTQWFSQTRQGWVLPIKAGVIAPADLLTIPPSAKTNSGHFHIDGIQIQLQQQAQQYVEGVKFLPYLHQHAAWQTLPQRIAAIPEDVFIFTEPNSAVRHISADLFEVTEQGWQIMPTVRLDANWHGAAVLARQDNALLGMLLITEQTAQVAVFNQALPAASDPIPEANEERIQ